MSARSEMESGPFGVINACIASCSDLAQALYNTTVRIGFAPNPSTSPMSHVEHQDWAAEVVLPRELPSGTVRIRDYAYGKTPLDALLALEQILRQRARASLDRLLTTLGPVKP